MRVAFFSTASLFCIDVEALQHPVCINRELEHFISAVFAAPEVRVNFCAAQVGVINVATNNQSITHMISRASVVANLLVNRQFWNPLIRTYHVSVISDASRDIPVVSQFVLEACCVMISVLPVGDYRSSATAFNGNKDVVQLVPVVPANGKIKPQSVIDIVVQCQVARSVPSSAVYRYWPVYRYHDRH